MACVLLMKKSSFENNKDNCDKHINFLTKRLEKENLQVTREEENSNTTLLRIDLSNNCTLEMQAEGQGFFKPIITNTSRIKKEEGMVAHELNQFMRSKCNHDNSNDDESFWYPCEKLDLAHGTLHNMKIGNKDLNHVK